MIGNLRDVDQAVHTGDDLRERAESDQLDDPDIGHIADAVGGGEYRPRLSAVIFHAQGDLLLLPVHGDDIYLHRVAYGDDLGGMLDARPGQLGDVNHAVHAADIHKRAVRGETLYHAGIPLAFLDGGPDFRGPGGTLLILDGADGAHHTPAAAVDLGDAQTHGLADQLGHGHTPAQTGLGRGDKDAHAPDIGDDAALVLLGDHTLQGSLVLPGLLNGLPVLHGVQLPLGQGDYTLLVVDPQHNRLNLVADFRQILRLDGGIIGQLIDRNDAGVFRADIHIDLRRRHPGDRASDLFPRI